MFTARYRMTPLLTGAAIAAVLLTAAAISMPSAASAASAPARTSTAAPSAGSQWSVVPAGADGPDGRVSLRHVIEPGGAVDDFIAVSNLGPEAATYEVTAGDGAVGPSGAFDIRQSEPVDSGSWIAVSGLTGSAVTIGAGETAVLPVRIAVPADATPGDHPAGIVVAVSRAGEAVTVTHRVGVRLHLQVSGDVVSRLALGEVRSEFVPSWIPFAPGTLHVSATVANEGNVRMGAALTTTAAGALGIGASSATTTAGELLPGDTAEVVTSMTAWPMAALFGDAVVEGVLVGQDTVRPAAAVESSFSQIAISWTGLVVLALVAGGVVAVVVARRRRRSPEPAGVRG
ncbi:hypothetical protein [Microbacterium sp. 18062]|uniref:hypothetical protein n=1 Tax=Microbacterium sp. 18062 TaxID=2681410 RepID=UPI00135C0BA7|nr:hypothetical protein [Microbacterium sp. 18062]